MFSACLQIIVPFCCLWCTFPTSHIPCHAFYLTACDRRSKTVTLLKAESFSVSAQKKLFSNKDAIIKEVGRKWSWELCILLCIGIRADSLYDSPVGLEMSWMYLNNTSLNFEKFFLPALWPEEQKSSALLLSKQLKRRCIQKTDYCEDDNSAVWRMKSWERPSGIRRFFRNYR